jgi:hypothetical protein
MLLRAYYLVVFLLVSAPTLIADATFDLNGPTIQIKVERKGTTLPISEVSNLAEGDRLYIHPQMPEDQAAHYVLVVAFLRGATNPPPEQWFTRAELWNKKYRQEGVFVTVPKGAEQAVLFLAPETSGDFSTLRSAVRGKPGAFVRAVQDLQRASLDRSRLDTYLAAVHKTADEDPTKVHDVSLLLARSLNIQLQDDCFKKPVEEQAACLTQKGGDMILNDGHSQSVVGTLTNGPSSDLMGQLAYTPQAGSGYFSPYIGAIVDIGRILDSLHTAQYQYIPALSMPENDVLELKLNNPPSFHNPKSVIVVGLPAIRSEQPPPLKLSDPNVGTCAQKKPLVLEAMGAPLAFSTKLLHGVVLHVETKNTKADLPLTADASLGGFVVDPNALEKAKLNLESGASIKGTLHASWGFDSFTGPEFTLVAAKNTNWTVPSADQKSLMAGSAHTLHLQSAEAVCVERVTLNDENSAALKTSWKVAKPDEVEVNIPEESAKNPGRVTLAMHEWSLPQDQVLPLRIYSRPGEFRTFSIIPGDGYGILYGTGLADVASLDLKSAAFKPDSASGSGSSTSELRLVTNDVAVTASLKPTQSELARVILNDGRTLEVPVTVQALRPRVHLLSKAIELGPVSQASGIQFSDESELPLDGTLSFAIKTDQPSVFPPHEKIEIATADNSFHVLLRGEDGTLTPQDEQTVVGRLSPLKCFGPSAFGPLRFRAVDERGIAGDWQPLATLVRSPSLSELDCPSDAAQACVLKGSNLFLIDAVSSDPQFEHPTAVPEGFLNSTLSIPHPAAETLYLKLRDNPSAVNAAKVPMKLVPPPVSANAPGVPVSAPNVH